MVDHPFLSLEGINLDWVSFEVKAMNGMFDQPPQQPVHQSRPGFPGRLSKPSDHAVISNSLDNLNDESPPLKVMKNDPKAPEDFEMNLGQDEEEALVPVRDTLINRNHWTVSTADSCSSSEIHFEFIKMIVIPISERIFFEWERYRQTGNT